MVLKPRQLDVLKLLVHLFINNHQPVGSSTLKTEGIDASSATIRNDLALLEAKGFIEKTHVSSGRIPSLKGYRYYIDHLLQPLPLSEEERRAIREQLQTNEPLLQNFLGQSAMQLAELTGCTTFISELNQESCILTAFQLVFLNEQQVMAVMVNNRGNVEKRLYPVERDFTPEWLQEIEHFVQDEFVGESIMTIQQRLKTELPITLQRVFTQSNFVLSLLNTIFEEVFKGQCYIGGEMNLLDAYQNELPRFKKVHKWIHSEAGESLLQCPTDDCIHIYLGSELKTPLLEDMALIKMRYQVAPYGSGVLAVLGPAGLSYPRILSLLRCFKEEFEQQVANYHLLVHNPLT